MTDECRKEFEELEPCWHCGGNAKIAGWINIPKLGDGTHATCQDVSCAVSCHSFPLQVWNRRAEKGVVADDERVERVKLALQPYLFDGRECETNAAKAVIEAIGSRAEQWRPISDAPKTGERILLFIDHPEFPCICNGSWTDFNGGDWTWYGGTGKPTHFMPLPQPPKGE